MLITCNINEYKCMSTLHLASLYVDIVPSDSTKPHIRNTTDQDDSWNIVTVIVGFVTVVIIAALVVVNVVAFFVMNIGSLRNEQGLRYKAEGGTCVFF